LGLSQNGLIHNWCTGGWPLRRRNVPAAFLENYNAPRRRGHFIFWNMCCRFFSHYAIKTHLSQWDVFSVMSKLDLEAQSIWGNVWMVLTPTTWIMLSLWLLEKVHLRIKKSHPLASIIGKFQFTGAVVAMTIDNHCVNGCETHAILHSI
jgi:hypothetical protein